eukprot:TRINITY_DN4315_c0_g1_i1.p1 TRINITY_DN4315_c0_g1~~TRINITY_DN4315_c0_g1_i1.p1  ORF type:complete len:1175 (-),score=146.41 TRINITY_DN4315_c0_g1_i1:144-3668(-)
MMMLQIKNWSKRTAVTDASSVSVEKERDNANTCIDEQEDTVVVFGSEERRKAEEQPAPVVEGVDEGEVVFVVEGKTITAHRAAVCRASAVFEAMLSSGMREGQGGVEIEVPNYHHHIFRKLIAYVHSSANNPTSSAVSPRCARLDSIAEALELLQAADQYQVLPLAYYCIEYLKQHTTMEVIEDVIQIGCLLQLSDLSSILTNLHKDSKRGFFSLSAMTPLQIQEAAVRAVIKGYRRAVKRFCSFIDKNWPALSLTFKNSLLKTALKCRSGEQMVQLLLDMGAKPEVEHLFSAIKEGEAMLSLLLHYSYATVNEFGDSQRTMKPLDYAFEYYSSARYHRSRLSGSQAGIGTTGLTSSGPPIGVSPKATHRSGETSAEESRTNSVPLSLSPSPAPLSQSSNGGRGNTTGNARLSKMDNVIAVLVKYMLKQDPSALLWKHLCRMIEKDLVKSTEVALAGKDWNCSYVQGKTSCEGRYNSGRNCKEFHQTISDAFARAVSNSPSVYSNEEMVVVLLLNGVAMPLQHYIYKLIDKGYLRALHVWCSKGLDILQRDSCFRGKQGCSMYHRTPLEYAIIRNRNDIAQLFIQANQNVITQATLHSLVKFNSCAHRRRTSVHSPHNPSPSETAAPSPSSPRFESTNASSSTSNPLSSSTTPIRSTNPLNSSGNAVGRPSSVPISIGPTTISQHQTGMNSSPDLLTSPSSSPPVFLFPHMSPVNTPHTDGAEESPLKDLDQVLSASKRRTGARGRSVSTVNPYQKEPIEGHTTSARNISTNLFEKDDDGLTLLSDSLALVSPLPAHSVIESLDPFAVITRLIELGVNINAISAKQGNTALHEAVYHGDVKMTEFLLKHNANVNATNTSKDTPLHVALSLDQLSDSIKLELVQCLIARGADCEQQNGREEKPIHLAAMLHTSIPLTLFLTQHGVHVNAPLCNDMSSLIWAAKEGNYLLLSTLMSSICDFDLYTRDKKGMTCLHYAVERDNQDMIKAILERQPLSGLLDLHLLNLAAAKGNKAMVDLVKNLVIERKLQREELATWALHKQYYHVLRDLLRNGADPNIVVDTSQWDWLADRPKSEPTTDTLLHTACQQGRLQVVQGLLNAGAVVNVLNSGRWSPLFSAASNGHIGIVALLLQNGADPEQWDVQGQTALHVAQQQKGHIPPETIRAIVDLLENAVWL